MHREDGDGVNSGFDEVDRELVDIDERGRCGGVVDRKQFLARGATTSRHAKRNGTALEADLLGPIDRLDALDALHDRDLRANAMGNCRCAVLCARNRKRTGTSTPTRRHEAPLRYTASPHEVDIKGAAGDGVFATERPISYGDRGTARTRVGSRRSDQIDACPRNRADLSGTTDKV
jgi:hypothetical protein